MRFKDIYEKLKSRLNHHQCILNKVSRNNLNLLIKFWLLVFLSFVWRIVGGTLKTDNRRHHVTVLSQVLIRLWGFLRIVFRISRNVRTLLEPSSITNDWKRGWRRHKSTKMRFRWRERYLGEGWCVRDESGWNQTWQYEILPCSFNINHDKEIKMRCHPWQRRFVSLSVSN